MKKIVKSLVLLAAFLTAHSAHAFMEGFSPYAGIEASSWHRGAGNIFLGGNFCENWGAEIGFTQTRRTYSYDYFGYYPRYISTLDKTSFSQLYLDLNGYWPFCGRWALIGSIGVGAVKPNLKFTNLWVNYNAVSTSNISVTNKTQAVLRLGFGVQVMLTECFGIRGSLRWLSTSHLKASGAIPAYGVTFTQRYYNSGMASLGAFWKF